MLVAELDGAADVAGTFGEDENRQFTTNNGNERFEFEVALILGGATVAPGLRVVAGVVHPVGKLVDLFFVFLLGLREWLVFSGECREIERLRFDFRPVEDHGDALFNEHVVDGPTGEVDRGSLAAEDIGGTAGIEAAAGRDGENFSDASGAGDGNMLAGRQDGVGGDSIRVESAGLGGIDGGADGGDFA